MRSSSVILFSALLLSACQAQQSSVSQNHFSSAYPGAQRSLAARFHTPNSHIALTPNVQQAAEVSPVSVDDVANITSPKAEEFGPGLARFESLPALYAESFGPAYAEPVSIALYSENFGPQAEAAPIVTAAAPQIASQAYGLEFGHISLTASAETTVPALYAEEFGPQATVMAAETAPALYAEAFGPAQPQPKMTPIPAADASMETAFSDSSKVGKGELSTVRGAFSPTDLNLNLLDAVNAHNSSNGNTGSNVIDGTAFTGSSGLVNLIQNSGNNVIIQSATIVNLTTQ